MQVLRTISRAIRLKNFTRKADNILDSFSHEIRSHLPAAARSTLSKLLNEKPFLNLTELLLENRTLAAPFGTKTLRADASRAIGIIGVSTFDSIDSFITWSRAFVAFTVYRVALNPNLPLTK